MKPKMKIEGEIDNQIYQYHPDLIALKEKIFKFLKKNRYRIIDLALENRNKVGYVYAEANVRFQFVEPAFQFMEGKFDVKKFLRMNKGLKPYQPETTTETFFAYYEIFFHYWNIRVSYYDLVIIGNREDGSQHYEY